MASLTDLPSATGAAADAGGHQPAARAAAAHQEDGHADDEDNTADDESGYQANCGAGIL